MLFDKTIIWFLFDILFFPLLFIYIFLIYLLLSVLLKYFFIFIFYFLLVISWLLEAIFLGKRSFKFLILFVWNLLLSSFIEQVSFLSIIFIKLISGDVLWFIILFIKLIILKFVDFEIIALFLYCFLNYIHLIYFLFELFGKNYFYCFKINLDYFLINFSFYFFSLSINK